MTGQQQSGIISALQQWALIIAIGFGVLMTLFGIYEAAASILGFPVYTTTPWAPLSFGAVTLWVLWYRETGRKAKK